LHILLGTWFHLYIALSITLKYIIKYMSHHMTCGISGVNVINSSLRFWINNVRNQIFNKLGSQFLAIFIINWLLNLYKIGFLALYRIVLTVVKNVVLCRFIIFQIIKKVIYYYFKNSKSASKMRFTILRSQLRSFWSLIECFQQILHSDLALVHLTRHNKCTFF